jgi:hypothetical protein
MWQLMRTVRTVDAEWKQVLQGSLNMAAKEDESSTGHLWTAGYHYVTDHFPLTGVL